MHEAIKIDLGITETSHVPNIKSERFRLSLATLSQFRPDIILALLTSVSRLLSRHILAGAIVTCEPREYVNGGGRWGCRTAILSECSGRAAVYPILRRF